jgi:hypothetical protein
VSGWVEQAQGWQAQNGANAAPTLKLNAFNFNPALTFGASGASELNFGQQLITAASGGMTVFAVADPAAAGGSNHLLLDAGAYPDGGYGLAFSADNSQGRAPAADSAGASQTVQATPSGDRPCSPMV